MVTLVEKSWGRQSQVSSSEDHECTNVHGKPSCSCLGQIDKLTDMAKKKDIEYFKQSYTQT